MVVKFRSANEFHKAEALKRAFPNLVNGSMNNLNLRELAEKIVNSDKKHLFSNYRPNSLLRYIRGALDGGKYEQLEFEGLDLEYKERYTKRRIQRWVDSQAYTPFNDDEKKLIEDLYVNEKFSPKQIYNIHLRQKGYPQRSLSSIDDYISKNIRRKGIRHRVNWKSEIGDMAIFLLLKYGKNGNYLVDNAKSLDDYYYEGKKKITRKDLGNFYKRNKTLCEIVEDK